MLSLIRSRIRAVMFPGSPAMRAPRRDEPTFWILFAR